jgi:hypothetical protein
VVDGSGLDNRQGASTRGFESLPLRQSVISGPMNFGGELALDAIGVEGSGREVDGPGSSHADSRHRVSDRFQVGIVAGNAAVINIVTCDIRFGILIPSQVYVSNCRVWIIAVFDDYIVSLRRR